MPQGIDLTVITGKVDAQDLLILLQAFSYDLYVSRLQVVVRHVYMEQRLVP